MALACDQTRVFAHFLTDPVNNLLFPGATAGHHELTHDEPDPQPEVNAITIQCVDEFRYLIEALRNVAEADETLLDHSAILGTTDVSLGRTHSLDDFPILVGGGACGKLRQGVHVPATGQNATQVLLTLIRAVGVTQASFGTDDAYTEDGLSEIEL
jgi:hypothetical protein